MLFPDTISPYTSNSGRTVFITCPSLYHLICAIVESGVLVINVSPKQEPVEVILTTGNGLMVKFVGES